jgi:hypothetical protein
MLTFLFGFTEYGSPSVLVTRRLGLYEDSGTEKGDAGQPKQIYVPGPDGEYEEIHLDVY